MDEQINIKYSFKYSSILILNMVGSLIICYCLAKYSTTKWLKTTIITCYPHGCKGFGIQKWLNVIVI